MQRPRPKVTPSRGWPRIPLLRAALPLLAAAVLAACASGGLSAPPPAWADARQLVLVTTAGWDADQGQLRRYERSDGTRAWTPVGEPSPVMVGRAGSAWGIGLHPGEVQGPRKREGDGRAPAGVFRIGTAFGYAGEATTTWPYQAMQASDYCIDVSGSPLYNRIVDADVVGAAAVAGSTEPMRRDVHANGDQRYRLGFVIEHNPDHRAGAGSCIFAHLWKAPGETTAGCTAMAEPAMVELLGWLQPAHRPVFVLLPLDAYEEQRKAWGLPPLAGSR